MRKAQSDNGEVPAHLRDEGIVYPARPVPSAEDLDDAEVEELVALIDKFGLSGTSRRLRMYRYTLAHLASRGAVRDGTNQLYRARLFEAHFRGDLDEAKKI